MRFLKQHFYLGLLVLTGWTACSSKEEKVDYFPITQNSLWEYDLTYVVPAMGSKTGMYKGKVVGKETFGEKEYFKVEVETSGVPGEEKKVEYLRKSEEGVYRILENDESKTEHLLMPTPLAVGTKWTVSGPEGDIDYEVESKETADVAGQKYKNCFKIGFAGRMNISDQEGKATGLSYRAPNVGEVKTDVALVLGDNVTITIAMERNTIRH